MGSLNLICPFCMTMLHKDNLFPRGRSARSPLKLVDRFPDHPEIGTLHDNFTWVSLLHLSHFRTQRTGILCLLLILIIYIAFDLWFYFLHFRRSTDVYRDYKYLGTRIRCDGTVGEWVLCYRWISNSFAVGFSIFCDKSSLFKVQMDDIWRSRYCSDSIRFWPCKSWYTKGEWLNA